MLGRVEYHTSYAMVCGFGAISHPVASGTVVVCKSNTRVLGARQLVSGKKSKEHHTNNIPLLGSPLAKNT
jgi:hypothetical protein